VLCRGPLRQFVPGASAWDGYRLLVDCAGQVRLERIRNSGVVLVHDWTPLVA
jgi:hypothetical protein